MKEYLNLNEMTDSKSLPAFKLLGAASLLLVRGRHFLFVGGSSLVFEGSVFEQWWKKLL